MIHIQKYESNLKGLWDKFITHSKNGVFLFYRDYMEYHSHRFRDYSLMFFDDETLVGIMPANADHDCLVSHGGLTFGGIVTDRKMRAPLMVELFFQLQNYLKAQGFRTLVYKVIPHIYHDIPAEEDLYALFIHHATLIRRDVSSTIFLGHKVPFSKGRKWILKKGQSHGFHVQRSYEFRRFMSIETANLNRKYGLMPAHTAEELELLAGKFPENIKLFVSSDATGIGAGVVVYESNHVAHAQYIAASDEGKELGAADVILDYLINEYYCNKRFFDFGISTEMEGRYLNEGLIQNKEGFGARATVYDFYEVGLTQKS